MNVTVVEVRRGADQKLYPARPLTREQRIRARRLAHNLVCRDGMSIRTAQQVMREQYGLRRSLGIISRDLRGWECSSCADKAPDPAPEPRQPSPPAAVHHAPGGLTGMLHDG